MIERGTGKLMNSEGLKLFPERSYLLLMTAVIGLAATACFTAIAPPAAGEALDAVYLFVICHLSFVICHSAEDRSALRVRIF